MNDMTLYRSSGDLLGSIGTLTGVSQIASQLLAVSASYGLNYLVSVILLGLLIHSHSLAVRVRAEQ